MFLYARGEDAVADDTGVPSSSGMDAVAQGYYAQYPEDLAGTSITAPGNPPVVTVHPGELWLIALKVTQSNPDTGSPETVWHVYALTSRDIPGWPLSTGYSGFLTAQTTAQALKDAGHDVALRRYTDFAVDYTAQTITLT